jgi:CRP-like cAMP-binding protein
MPSPQDLLVQFIRSHFSMPEANACAIAERFAERAFRKGDLVLKEGMQCTDYHFLCSGFMRAWTIDLQGHEVTTGLYPAGNVVFEVYSFFKHVPARENIQAATDCSTLCINFAGLQDAFHSLPEFREFGRSLLVNAYAGLKQRMLSGLHDTAEQRYKNLLTSAPEVFQHVPLKHIASYLGITDTSLSRIRKEFTKQ